MVSTIAGVAIMWALVSYLHSGEEHDHAADTIAIEESTHSDEHE
jgi:ZIP family zinc transporter